MKWWTYWQPCKTWPQRPMNAMADAQRPNGSAMSAGSEVEHVKRNLNEGWKNAAEESVRR